MNFYRRFIWIYGKVTLPLMELLKKTEASQRDKIVTLTAKWE
jgi:hypothetical protein